MGHPRWPAKKKGQVYWVQEQKLMAGYQSVLFYFFSGRSVLWHSLVMEHKQKWVCGPSENLKNGNNYTYVDIIFQKIIKDVKYNDRLINTETALLPHFTFFLVELIKDASFSFCISESNYKNFHASSILKIHKQSEAEYSNGNSPHLKFSWPEFSNTVRKKTWLYLCKYKHPQLCVVTFGC